jgi:hypothetical protein
LYRLLAVSLSLLMACLAGELLLRLIGYSRSYVNPGGSFLDFDPLLGARGKPNFSGRFQTRDFDIVVAHDQNGFRRPVEHPELPSPQRDVYVIGDSFVWGCGVGQTGVLTNRMETLMPGYRVHNFGIAGSGTVEQYTVFKTHIRDQLRAEDTVVVAFYAGNDFGDNVGRFFHDRLHATIRDGKVCEVPPSGERSTVKQLKNSLKDHSCLFNLVTFCIDRFKYSGVAVRSSQRSKRQPPPAEEIAAAAADNGAPVVVTRFYLAEFKKACAEKGVNLLVAYIPGQAELGEDDFSSTDEFTGPEEAAFRPAFFRITQSLGIKTLDLLPPLLATKQAGRFDRLTFCYDQHWNEHGHLVGAEALSSLIVETDKQRLAGLPRSLR